MPQPRPPDVSDTQEVLRAVRRIARALALSSRELARRHGLTEPQLMCLRLLRDADARSAGALATALSLSPQTVTGLIDRLHGRQLVERVRSDVDRRQVLVSLTDTGKALLADAAPPLQDRFVARLNALTPAKRQALRTALETVVGLLEADALDAAPLLAAGTSLASPLRTSTHGDEERHGSLLEPSLDPRETPGTAEFP